MSLSLADHVIMTDIFAAREEEIVGVDSKKMASQIGVKATYRDDGDILPYLDMHTHGVIVVMGAGDTEHIKNDVLFKYI